VLDGHDHGVAGLERVQALRGGEGQSGVLLPHLVLGKERVDAIVLVGERGGGGEMGYNSQDRMLFTYTYTYTYYTYTYIHTYLHEGGEALVEPEPVPPIHRHQVAEP
jgi:hypothetical protein